MLKKFLIIFLCLFSFCIAQETTSDNVIQAGIKYNEATARIAAFQNVEYKIKKADFKDRFKEYLKDKYKKENIASIKTKIFEINYQEQNKNKTRFLCPFYMDKTLITYAVVYKDKLEYAFYYNIFGSLMKVDIRENLAQNYPKKILSYSKYGNLLGIIFETSDSEQFVYNDKGKLIARWVDKNLYDKENNIPKFIKIQRGTLE